MQVGLVGVHHPRDGHREELVARVRRAAEVIGAAPGCLSAQCRLTPDGAVVSTAHWVSQDAQTASFALARQAGVDFTYDDREERPREIFRLVVP